MTTLLNFNRTNIKAKLSMTILCISNIAARHPTRNFIRKVHWCIKNISKLSCTVITSIRGECSGSNLVRFICCLRLPVSQIVMVSYYITHNYIPPGHWAGECNFKMHLFHNNLSLFLYFACNEGRFLI